MVGVAQLVEPRVVISAVVGSSPIVHPISRTAGLLGLFAGFAPLGRRWWQRRRCAASVAASVSTHPVKAAALKYMRD